MCACVCGEGGAAQTLTLRGARGDRGGGAAAVAPLPPALVRTELPLLRCGVARGHRAPRTPPGRREPASRALQTRLLTANFKDRRKSYKVSLFKCLIYKLDCYTINQKVN